MLKPCLKEAKKRTNDKIITKTYQIDESLKNL